MKLIGKQIVVELPEKWKPGIDYNPEDRSENWMEFGRNKALSEVARMNPAMEVDVEELADYLFRSEIPLDIPRMPTAIPNRPIEQCIKLAQALASNPSAWMKRKE